MGGGQQTDPRPAQGQVKSRTQTPRGRAPSRPLFEAGTGKQPLTTLAECAAEMNRLAAARNLSGLASLVASRMPAARITPDASILLGCTEALGAAGADARLAPGFQALVAAVAGALKATRAVLSSQGFSLFFAACARAGNPSAGADLLWHARKTGAAPQPAALEALAESAARSGRLTDVFKTLGALQASGAKPGAGLANAALGRCAALGGLKSVNQCFGVLKAGSGFAGDTATLNVLVGAAAAAGDMTAAHTRIAQMKSVGVLPDAGTAALLMAAYAARGKASHVAMVYSDSRRAVARPGIGEYERMLRAVKGAPLVGVVKRILADMKEQGVQGTTGTYSAALVSLAAVGRARDCVELATEMLERGVGPAEEAVDATRRMRAETGDGTVPFDWESWEKSVVKVPVESSSPTPSPLAK